MITFIKQIHAALSTFSILVTLTLPLTPYLGIVGVKRKESILCLIIQDFIFFIIFYFFTIYGCPLNVFESSVERPSSKLNFVICLFFLAASLSVHIAMRHKKH